MELENSVDTQSAEPATLEGMPEATPTLEAQEEKASTDAQPTQSEQEEQYTVKVNGREVQLNKQDLIKYAQLGHASQSAFQKAAETERKHRQMHSQLVQVAEQDPFLLYQVLTGKVHPKAALATQQKMPGAKSDGEDHDPRDQMLRETQEKLSRLEQRLEQEDIAREQKAIEQEMSDAVKKWPVLNTPANIAFVKSQYAAALKNGLDHSLEDVAFYCAQAEKQRLLSAQKAADQRIKDANKRAPIVTSTGAGVSEKKPMTLEDVKKLAGRI